MKRLSPWRVLALALVLVLLGAACGGSSSDAATVDGKAISRSALTDELKALIGAVDKVPADQLSETDKKSLLAQLTTEDGKTPKASAAADLLTNKIISLLVAKGITDFNLTVEEQDTTASTQDISNSLYNFASEATKKAAIDDGARTSRLSRFLEDTTKPWYTDADVEAYYKLKKDTAFSTAQACTSHILVKDEATAGKLLADIKAGADFAKVAAANSTDESNKDKGGDLGCNAEGQFVKEFEDAVKGAKDGDIIGPVKTEFGYHIIKVTSAYKVPVFDDALKAQIKSTLSSPVGWLEYTLAKTKITVSRRFGTWDVVQHKVLPPGAAVSGASGTGANGK